MMKKNLWLVVLVVVVVGGYFLLAEKGGRKVMLTEQNGSGESGTAVFKVVDGKVQVSLTVTGQPAGVAQPAHIHTGTCAQIGAVVYPLTFPKDGATSVTLLDTTLEAIKAKGPLAMNVHKSGAQANVYVACGDLSF